MKLETPTRQPDIDYSSSLEVGDYVPYFFIQNGDRVLDLQVKACRHNLLVILDSQGTSSIEAALDAPRQFQTFVITDAPVQGSDPRLFHDENVARLFRSKDDPVTLVLCDRNLKISAVRRGRDFNEVFARLPAADSLPFTGAPPPVLLVPNVISEDLSQRLISHLESNQDQAFSRVSDYKSRSHIHPDPALELELDDKLSKSLLPEIAKVFYSEISHRETYKICCYSAEDAGCFGKHRDTIHPHLHRRYAMTLVLNDDYEGGGISFPEYTDEIIDVPRNWAVVFPGSLFHQVNNIGVGKRYVVISFFFTEAEARLKEGSERYRFRVQRDLCGISVNKLTPDYEPR